MEYSSHLCESYHACLNARCFVPKHFEGKIIRDGWVGPSALPLLIPPGPGGFCVHLSIIRSAPGITDSDMEVGPAKVSMSLAFVSDNSVSLAESSYQMFSSQSSLSNVAYIWDSVAWRFPLHPAISSEISSEVSALERFLKKLVTFVCIGYYLSTSNSNCSFQKVKNDRLYGKS